MITPGGISSIWLGKLSPLRLVHLIIGVGIPPVTRHWNNTLPPSVTVCLPLGYNSIVGASLPNKLCVVIFETNLFNNIIIWFNKYVRSISIIEDACAVPPSFVALQTYIPRSLTWADGMRSTDPLI